MNPDPNERPSKRYGWWVVTVFVLAMVVAYVDRQIVSILAQDMKRDLLFSDTQIGWLHTGFAIFYAIGGLPIAWLIDRYSRRGMVSLAILFWTLMTFASATTKQFATLLLYRIGVGVGEATITPAAHSWFGAVIERRSLPLALSLLQLGPVVGSGLGFFVSAVVLGNLRGGDPVALPGFGEVFAWQVSYIYVGLPGLLVLALLYTLREPPHVPPPPKTRETTRSEILAFYRREWRTLLCHHLGFSLLVLMGNAFVFWSIVWFERIHGIPAEQSGRWVGLLFIFLGGPAVIVSALLAQYVMRKRGGGGILATASLSALGLVALIALIQFTPDARWALIAYTPAFFFLNMPYGLAQGALPLITPAHMRARVAAVYSLSYMIGTATGPLILGWVNDHIYPSPDGIRDSMLLVTASFGLTAVVLLWIGRGPYTRTFERAEAEALAQAANQ